MTDLKPNSVVPATIDIIEIVSLPEVRITRIVTGRPSPMSSIRDRLYALALDRIGWTACEHLNLVASHDIDDLFAHASVTVSCLKISTAARVSRKTPRPRDSGR